MKPWQKGYELDLLREFAQRFQRHDGNRCLGAFSKVKENTVANWLSEGRLFTDGNSAVVLRHSKSKQTVKDFRGEPVAIADPGTVIVERVYGTATNIASLIESHANGGAILWKSWANHPQELDAVQALNLQKVGTFISAASEIKSMWGRQLHRTPNQPSDADFVGIGCTSVPAPDMSIVESWVPLVQQLWQDHYSSYNKRKSWHAVSLRSFGGDPGFIEKPAEMSKKWKEEHPDMIDAVCRDTPLVSQLPFAYELLDSFNCPLERVRLMRLTGGGGELSRHADITDRNAGLANGQIARFHLPIVTHPSVEFTTWDTNDIPDTVHMEYGKWWYLDVRKPHAAVNPSGVERVHLVADLVVNDWVRSAIVDGI